LLSLFPIIYAIVQISISSFRVRVFLDYISDFGDFFVLLFGHWYFRVLAIDSFCIFLLDLFMTSTYFIMIFSMRFTL